MTYDHLLRAIVGKQYHGPRQNYLLKRQIANARLGADERELLLAFLDARTGSDAKTVARHGMEGLRPTGRRARRIRRRASK